MLERIICGIIFGAPGAILIVYNYYRIFAKTRTASPVYIIGGILGAIGVLAFLGSDIKSRWYLILIPIVLDWGLCAVSLISAIRGEPVQKSEEIQQSE